MKSVIYEKRNRICYVTLNRPQALNALNDQINEELSCIWQEFAADDSVDVAILTGAGKSFCAGADLKTFIPKWEGAGIEAVKKNAEKEGIGGGLTRGQHTLAKPVIAAINGHAVGGGFELALACDIRIAAENARFGVFEVRFGLHQGDGGIVRLVAIAGLATALELSLTGREVTAQEAFHLGLVNKVVPEEEIMTCAEQYAEMIKNNSQKAIRSAKQTILNMLGLTLADALNREALKGYGCLIDGNDASQRLADFIQRSSNTDSSV